MSIIQIQIQKFYSERQFTKNIKIFLQLYVSKSDLLTCHQDLGDAAIIRF